MSQRVKATNLILSIATLVWGGMVLTRPIQAQQPVTAPSVTASPHVLSSVSPVVSSQVVITPSQKPAKQVLTTKNPSPAQSQTVIASSPPSVVPQASPSVAHSTAYRIETGAQIISGEIEVMGTVGEVTAKIAQKHGITFMYENTRMGWFITEIAGVKQNPRTGHYWVYEVNGQLGNVAANMAEIKPGDTLVWHYTAT